MKVISTGSARINCPQCGSVLEYEWRDIVEEQSGCFYVFCPVCGRMISVPEFVEPNPYQSLHGCTITTDTFQLHKHPYNVFERDALYASNGSANCDGVSVLSCSTTKAKDDDACTLTATI